MGWKAIKEYYNISHIVSVVDGSVCIGSSYAHDLLIIRKDGEVNWGKLGPSHNDDLGRYYEEMMADQNKLKELFLVEDHFTESIPVYTFTNEGIVEKFCEKAGWPNVTHDGELMYENTFSTDKMVIVKETNRLLKNRIKYSKEIIDGKEKEIVDWKEHIVDSQLKLNKLLIQYPEVK